MPISFFFFGLSLSLVLSLYNLFSLLLLMTGGRSDPQLSLFCRAQLTHQKYQQISGCVWECGSLFFIYISTECYSFCISACSVGEVLRIDIFFFFLRSKLLSSKRLLSYQACSGGSALLEFCGSWLLFPSVCIYVIFLRTLAGVVFPFLCDILLWFLFSELCFLFCSLPRPLSFYYRKQTGCETHELKGSLCEIKKKKKRERRLIIASWSYKAIFAFWGLSREAKERARDTCTRAQLLLYVHPRRCTRLLCLQVRAAAIVLSVSR